MRNKILALLLCISLGAGAVPSFAAESEKTASAAVVAEAGKTSVAETGSGQVTSAEAAVGAGETSGTETGSGQVTSSTAAAVEAGGLTESEAADVTSEASASESDIDLGDLISVEADKVEEVITEINDTAVELLEKMENVDKDELMKDLMALQVLLQSEEFQTIMNYQEIKELIQEMIATVIDFARTDQDLCIEILDKLGVPRVLGTVIMEGLAVSSLTGDMVRKLSVDDLFMQVDTFNAIINKVIQENDVLKAVSSLELNGGA